MAGIRTLIVLGVIPLVGDRIPAQNLAGIRTQNVSEMAQLGFIGIHHDTA